MYVVNKVSHINSVMHPTTASSAFRNLSESSQLTNYTATYSNHILTLTRPPVINLKFWSL